MSFYKGEQLIAGRGKRSGTGGSSGGVNCNCAEANSNGISSDSKMVRQSDMNLIATATGAQYTYSNEITITESGATAISSGDYCGVCKTHNVNYFTSPVAGNNGMMWQASGWISDATLLAIKNGTYTFPGQS